MSETGRKVFKASLVIMIAHLIFKITGPVQARVLLAFCGEDKVLADIFFFSYEIMLLTFFLVWEEGLGPAFLPVFMREVNNGNEKTAWRFASGVITLQTVFVSIVVLVVMLYPGQVIALMTDWDTNPDFEENMLRAPSVVRWIIPALFGLSIGSTTYLALNGYKKFFLAALGDSAVKFFIIISLFVGYLYGSTSIVWICAGVFAGSVAKLFTHAIGLGRRIFNFRPNLDFKSEQFLHFAMLVAPLIVGILFAKVRDIYNEGWVLSHVSQDGLITINKLGRKLFQAVGWLIPYSVSIAMYPFFCELVDKENKYELAAILLKSYQIILILIIPLTAIAVALAFPFTRIFFQLKGFGLDECRLASYSTIAYTLVLPFFALEYILMQAFFSNRKMATPIISGIIFSILSMVISYFGVVVFCDDIAAFLGSYFPVITKGAVALIVIGGAYTVCRSLKVIVLIHLLIKVLPDLKDYRALFFGIKMFFTGVLVFIATFSVRMAAELCFDVYEKEGFFNILSESLPYIIVSTFVGILVYIVSIRIMCRAEWLVAREWVFRKLKGIQGKK